MWRNKKIREKLYKLYRKEDVYNFLKEKEQKDGLTNKEKKLLKNIDKYLKNLKSLKKLEKDLEKLQKDHLFNELNELMKIIMNQKKKIKSAFDGNYILYESKGDKDAKLAIYEYFDKIKPYLKDMIDDYKSKGEWKIQLTMRIIFVSFIDKNETLAMHTKSDNIVIMSGTETNDIINELISSFVKRYQERLETKMKGSSYTFEQVDLLEHHFHKISLNRGSSYINCPERIKSKKSN